jgi:uncharacterized membrane protein YtjA (UPF0391 family)
LFIVLTIKGSTINQLPAAGEAKLSKAAFSGHSQFSGLRRPAKRCAKIRRRPGGPPAETNDGAEPGGDNTPSRPGGEKMLYYALVFFIIAVIAGLLGFGVIASAAAGIAKILFFVFLVLFIVTLISHASRGRTV